MSGTSKVSPSDKQPLSAFTADRLADAFESAGLPRWRASQVLEWYYRKGAREFSAMKNISSPVARYLEDNFTPLSSHVVDSHDAGDGAVKLEISLADGALIECVLIETPRRLTLCVSCQSGCPLGCSFCATGAGGFERNLRPFEIVEQALLAAAFAPGKRISHVVIMGMGEPCLNLDSVFDAILTFNAPWAFGIAARRITISTLGFPSCIERIAEFPLEVGLAVSLHTADDRLRKKLAPKAGATVAETIRAARAYFQRTRREVTYECVLLAGVNDSPRDASLLASALRGQRAFVNLIAFNEVEGLPYSRPSPRRIAAFGKALEAKGINVHLRDSRGRNANAACGQLKLRRKRGGLK